MNRKSPHNKKSIFRAIFVPLFLIMVLQSALFYVFAVYGGVQRSLDQNAADILSGRLTNRKNEIETQFNKSWTVLDTCAEQMNTLYAACQAEYGDAPFVGEKSVQIDFLRQVSAPLITALRSNNVNGIFLILNDETAPSVPAAGTVKQGVCIRDMDQTSTYTSNSDLLIMRAPSSLVSSIGCPLGSYWEPSYTLAEDSDFYYKPLQAAWDNPGVSGSDISYFSSTHNFATSDPAVVSYSIPLTDAAGRPYAVLGVELTVKYLASLLPSRELANSDEGSYVLATREQGSNICTPIAASGALYSRCFSSSDTINCGQNAQTGGFDLTARGGTELYGDVANIQIYNNNNPFEGTKLVLLALEEHRTLFYYSTHVRTLLFGISLLSLAIGLIGILVVSRRFAAPITALAQRAENVNADSNFTLGHLGITEIDQLVDSIEHLNQNVSREIARTEFFSRMSHDMRTPMNAIISFSSPELLENATPVQKDDYLTKIHSSGQFLLGLINEVLDITKIESNKVDLRCEPTATTQLWSVVLPIIEKLAQKQNIVFTPLLPTDDSSYVLADSQHLNQILLNLLSNAVKFTPEGGTVTLQIALNRTQSDSVMLHIRVADTGVGMSEEFLKKLYTPFEQESNGVTGGTGLGLSISKKLIDLMGGKISCRSQKGIGTTFDVDLPMKLCAKPDAAPGTGAMQNTDLAVLRGKHILLCEDHPLNLQIATKLLERQDISVESVENGKLGVDRFAACAPGTFDAILMDIRMPVMNGLDAAAAIRALPRGDAATIPIIAMTANAFAEDIAESHRAGMDAHLSKPINPQELYNTLAFLIKQCETTPQ